jgi:hypothetical protein
MVYEFSHGGTIAFDAQNKSTGVTAAAASGVISTGAASAIVFGLGSNYYNAFSSLTIAGSAANGSVAANAYNYLSYSIFTSLQTNIQAGHSCGAADAWNCGVLSIKEASGGLSIPIAMNLYRQFRA